jgi:tetratricopeptide (TPR) repeat protein
MASRQAAGFLRVAAAFSLALALTGCADLTRLAGGGSDETSYGDYLAARYASSVYDTAAAEKYFDKTLADDGHNPIVLERAFMTSIYAGDMSRAVSLANKLVKQAPDHRMARLILGLDDIRGHDYAEARTEIANAQAGVFADLVGSLTQAWAAAGEGDKAGALARLKTFEGKPAFNLFRAYHTAEILDMLGDTQGAADAYRQAFDASGGTSIRVVEAYASFLSRQGEMDKAKETLKHFLTISPEHPLALADYAQVQSGKVLAPLVADAPEGVAEALYGLGSALAQEPGSDLAILYLRLAIWMRPQFDVAHTLIADTFEQKKLWQEAINAYGEVRSSSPLYPNARIQTALDLVQLDREADAIAVLHDLAGDDPKALEPYVALGDIYRSKEKYAEAKKEYARAIELAGAPKPIHWSLYYARGICNERLGEWPSAERDLKHALKLSNDNPLVLNYLGYSWIEKGTHLEEAMEMIEKAVGMRPTDGFIVDSLGWANYRLGDYKQAVQVLQRAVELEPSDSTINDHLGDAFWKVGRKIEARFQWSHALEMKPQADRIKVLKAKLQYGLTAADDRAEQQSPRPAVSGS